MNIMSEKSVEIEDLVDEVLGFSSVENEESTVEVVESPVKKVVKEAKKKVDTSKIIIPTRISNIISNWVDVAGKTVDELSNSIRETYVTVDESVPDDNRWNRAVTLLRRTISVKSDGPQLTNKRDRVVTKHVGFFTHNSRVIDFAGFKRKAAREVNSVNESGRFTDPHEFFKNGKKNFNYGQPIPDHDYQITLFGVAKELGDDEAEFKKCAFQLNGEQANKMKIGKGNDKNVHLNVDKVYEFYAVDFSIDPIAPEMILRSDVKTYEHGFVPSDVKMDIKQMVSEKYENVSLNSLFNWALQHDGDYNATCVVEADIKYINPKNPRMLVLEDETLKPGQFGVTSWLNKLEDFNGVKGVRVRVFGKTSFNEYPKDSGNKAVNINIMRIDVLYSYNVVPENIESETVFAMWE